MPSKGWMSVRVEGIEGLEKIDKGKRSAYIREVLEKHFENEERQKCPACKGKGFVYVKINKK